VVDSRVAGQSLADSSYDTQDEASQRGRSLLEGVEDGGELVVHKKDGKVRDTTHIDFVNPNG
jgi:hypothetical protein